jgi:hypothetical protein
MSTFNDSDPIQQDYTLAYAHGTVMVVAWMLLASTGILFARYGRLFHIEGRVTILGEFIWFQIHRLALCLAAVATLLGFLLVFSQVSGQWVNTDNGPLFAHSILGIIIVCCSQIQVWMSIFRCHPDNRFRYIFNWMHRLTGLLAFILSIPTIFLIAFVLPNYNNGIISILSIWSAWIVIIVIIFEIIEYHSRKSSILSTDKRRKYEITDTNPTDNIETDRIDNPNTQSYNKIKSILFCIHILVSICLAISLIVLIWMQDYM